MNEIVRIEDPPMLHFGKYRGKSAAEVLDIDPGYVDWVMAQPWFQEKNPQLVQFFVGGKSDTSETPEHNALQAKFAQDAYCLAVVAMFSAGQRLRTRAVILQEAQVTVGPALASRIISTHPTIEERSFEVNAWDVQFAFSGASAEMDTSSEPDCSCTPIPLPELPDGPLFPSAVGTTEPPASAVDEYHRLCAEHRQTRDSRCSFETANRNRTVSKYTPYSTRRDMPFDKWQRMTLHEEDCPRSSKAYFTAWCCGDYDIAWVRSLDFGLELKPIMGDDFPAVLRQILGYVKRRDVRAGKIHAAVVVGAFRSVAVPWPIVKKQFWESGVLLIQEAELDGLVSAHAHEWGADLDHTGTDFTVDFTTQL